MSNRIALGTVQFGLRYGVNNRFGQVGEDEVRRILQRAMEGGIDTLDTAAAYGESERVLGTCMSNNADSFKIVSKYPPRSPLRPAQAAAASLAALRLNCMYGYLFHDVGDFFSDDGRKWHEFQDLKRNGTADRIGFSLYYPHHLKELFDRDLTFDIVQVPFSLLDRRFEGQFQELKQRGVEIHVRSIFLQGLVFRKLEALPEFLGPAKPSLRNLSIHAAEFGLSIQSLCLGFALSRPDVDRVVIGVDCMQDLEDDLRSAREAQRARIDWTALDDVECTDEKSLLPFNWKT
jgi:aryl-alcohol dehydrogenase-like predicted oxidoreductase